jgi:hypothetical protein
VSAGLTNSVTLASRVKTLHAGSKTVGFAIEPTERFISLNILANASRIRVPGTGVTSAPLVTVLVGSTIRRAVDVTSELEESIRAVGRTIRVLVLVVLAVAVAAAVPNRKKLPSIGGIEALPANEA